MITLLVTDPDPLLRVAINRYAPDPRSADAIERQQDTMTAVVSTVNEAATFINVLAEQPLLTFAAPDAQLDGAKALAGGSDVTVAIGDSVTLGLSDTGATPGSYGDPSHLATFTVDQKGRLQAAGQVALESGNVAETTNLFFTAARARAATFVSPPATSTSAGLAGQWSADAGYIYACYADNSWRRVAAGTF